MSRSIVPWMAAAVLLCGASAAQAGIYKCVGPDGRTTFTSDPGSCPNAKQHVLKTRVQNVIDPSAAEAASARMAARAAATSARIGRDDGDNKDGLEKMWRRKRGETHQKLQRVERRWTNLHRMIKGCNRGGQWFQKDESGIRRHVSCEDLRAKRQKLEQERDELKEYLRIGLEDDCRRAACKPGWIR